MVHFLPRLETPCVSVIQYVAIPTIFVVVVAAGIADKEVCVTSMHTVVVVVASRRESQQLWIAVELATAIFGETLAVSQ